MGSLSSGNGTTLSGILAGPGRGLNARSSALTSLLSGLQLFSYALPRVSICGWWSVSQPGKVIAVVPIIRLSECSRSCLAWLEVKCQVRLVIIIAAT